MDNKYKFNIEITNKCIIGCSGCPRTWFKKQFPKVKQTRFLNRYQQSGDKNSPK